MLVGHQRYLLHATYLSHFVCSKTSSAYNNEKGKTYIQLTSYRHKFCIIAVQNNSIASENVCLQYDATGVTGQGDHEHMHDQAQMVYINKSLAAGDWI